MRVGDYVRTKNGNISKIKFITHVVFFDNEIKSATICLENDETIRMYYGDIIKSSPNIIDLIEVGDYVNGEQVFTIEKVHNKNYALGVYENYLYEDDIKSIVTHQQFSSMEYKVESEVK